MLLAGAVTIALTLYGTEYRKWNIDRVYPVTVLIFAMLYMYVVPALKAPDEAIHFGRMIETANHWTIDAIAYTMPALGLNLARLTGWNGLYVGTFFNVIFYVALTSYAMKKLPFGKRTMYVICMLPITLQQAASLSYDCAILSSVMVVMSLSIKWVYAPIAHPHKSMTLTGKTFISNRVLPSEVVIYLLMACILLHVKNGAYAIMILLPLVLSIKFSWFRGFRKWIIFGVLAVVLVGLWIYLHSEAGLYRIWNFLMYIPYITEFKTYAAPPIYRLWNWRGTLAMLWQTVISEGKSYVYQMFGGQLGALDVFPWKPGVYLYLILFLMSLIRREKEHRDIRIPRRIFIVLFCLVPDLIAVFAMLFYWTPYDSTLILGIQGRYFLPSLFVLSGALGYWRKPAWKSHWMEEHENSLFAVASIALTTIMSYSVIGLF